MSDFIEIHDTSFASIIHYNSTDDTAYFKNNKNYLMRPFDPSWTQNFITPIKNEDAFYLGSVSSLTADVLPAKLQSLGFKNYTVGRADFNKTENYNGETYERICPYMKYIKFSDRADYAFFCVLFSDLIDFDKSVEFIDNSEKVS